MKQNMKPIEKETNTIEEIIAKQREKDASLHTLRVSCNTWIVVPKSKATPEYAMQYRRDRMGLKV